MTEREFDTSDGPQSQPAPAPAYMSECEAEEPEPCGCEESVALRVRIAAANALLERLVNAAAAGDVLHAIIIDARAHLAQRGAK